MARALLSLCESYSRAGTGIMAHSNSPTTGMVAAEPEPIALDWAATALLIIDMQRDFMEPGGFGETLGNDVSQLARAVKPIASVLKAAREAEMLVVHTREGHLPDLSDAPAAANDDVAAPQVISTASVWQARQPVYTHAVGRWRRYAEFVPELTTLFEE